MPDLVAAPEHQDTAAVAVDDEERPLLQLRGLTVRFGQNLALDNVDLDVRSGEVHALLGHNGAGKSTLIKALAGVNRLESGSMLFDGKPLTLAGPADALAAGISVVYQELSLFGSLSVAENLAGSFGGGLDTRLGTVRRRAMRKRAVRQLATMGLRIDPARTVDSLPVGEQQMIEIGRALFSGAKVVVLDEPTSALSPGETAVLFDFVKSMTAHGVTFILISHFLGEILDHADRVTVMRGGRNVGTVETANTTARELLALSLGDPDQVMASTYGEASTTLPPRSREPLVVRATGVHAAPRIRHMDLQVHRGEILGIYGEIGSGHEELAEALFGMTRLGGGELVVLGHVVGARRSEVMRELGVGYIPADRRRALALGKSISHNMSLAALHHISRGIVRPDRERRHAEHLIDKLGIVGAKATLPVGSLSGGNQQKALFGRWLIHPPKLLVLSEPTRGMDLRAKSDVLRAVLDLRERGTSVVLVTSEPETALAVADRVLVASRGEIVAEFSDTTVNNRDLLEAEL